MYWYSRILVSCLAPLIWLPPPSFIVSEMDIERNSEIDKGLEFDRLDIQAIHSSRELWTEWIAVVVTASRTLNSSFGNSATIRSFQRAWRDFVMTVCVFTCWISWFMTTGIGRQSAKPNVSLFVSLESCICLLLEQSRVVIYKATAWHRIAPYTNYF